MFGLSKNVIAMGAVSFLNDLSSDMIYPLIPVFLTTTLGASAAFVGLVEGFADATAGVLKVAAGRISDRLARRKPFVVFGYALSAVAKPILSVASAPWHVFAVRFIDRVGKGTRDAPRDALISISTDRRLFGKAFGFHRAADTLGATLGPLIAFAILPLVGNNLRTLFMFSFFASAVAVIILIAFVRDTSAPHAEGSAPGITFRLRDLGMPFIVFLAAATIFSLGRSSDAFLLLKAQQVGVAVALLPIIYFTYNASFALLSTPAGIVADRIGHRNTFMVGMLLLALCNLLFASVTSVRSLWLIFVLYGLYSALTEGVGRAIVAGLVEERHRATAFGVYSAATGVALLPASVIFGVLWDRFGTSMPFYYGAAMSLTALLLFLFLRIKKNGSR